MMNLKVIKAVGVLAEGEVVKGCEYEWQTDSVAVWCDKLGCLKRYPAKNFEIIL